MLICFDLDGTLVDSREDIAAAANAARTTFGLAALPVPTVASYVGNGLTKLLERAAPEVAVADRSRLTEAFHAHYLPHCCDRTTLYPGVAETIHKLAERGWTIVVATNKPGRYVQPICNALGIAGHIAGYRGGDGPKKPDPTMLHELAAETGQPLRWMIGDHDTDLKAGRAAGAQTVFCTWGIGHAGESPFDHAIDAMPQLLEVVGDPGR